MQYIKLVADFSLLENLTLATYYVRRLIDERVGDIYTTSVIARAQHLEITLVDGIPGEHRLLKLKLWLEERLKQYYPEFTVASITIEETEPTDIDIVLSIAAAFDAFLLRHKLDKANIAIIPTLYAAFVDGFYVGCDHAYAQEDRLEPRVIKNNGHSNA